MIAGPYPPAFQPQGLSVTLHPHQLQTLARLLAREYDFLGFSGLLWQGFQSGGAHWWMSLVLGKLSQQPPAATVTGGLLGKTS